MADAKKVFFAHYPDVKRAIDNVDIEGPPQKKFKKT